MPMSLAFPVKPQNTSARIVYVYEWNVNPNAKGKQPTAHGNASKSSSVPFHHFLVQLSAKTKTDEGLQHESKVNHITYSVFKVVLDCKANAVGASQLDTMQCNTMQKAKHKQTKTKRVRVNRKHTNAKGQMPNAQIPNAQIPNPQMPNVQN